MRLFVAEVNIFCLMPKIRRTNRKFIRVSKRNQSYLRLVSTVQFHVLKNIFVYHLLDLVWLDLMAYQPLL